MEQFKRKEARVWIRWFRTFFCLFCFLAMGSAAVHAAETDSAIERLEEVYITGFFKDAPQQQLHWTYVFRLCRTAVFFPACGNGFG